MISLDVRINRIWIHPSDYGYHDEKDNYRTSVKDLIYSVMSDVVIGLPAYMRSYWIKDTFGNIVYQTDYCSKFLYFILNMFSSMEDVSNFVFGLTSF